jgi:hypothetical protein
MEQWAAALSRKVIHDGTSNAGADIQMKTDVNDGPEGG